MDWGMGRHFYGQSKESQMMYYKVSIPLSLRSFPYEQPYIKEAWKDMSQ